MRLRIVPDDTKIDFFRAAKITFGASVLAMVVSIIAALVLGLNFGIDFQGGTTIRTESESAVDVGEYRNAIAPLGLGDVIITEVFDPSFGDDKNVASVRIQARTAPRASRPRRSPPSRRRCRASIRPSASRASKASGPRSRVS